MDINGMEYHKYRLSLRECIVNGLISVFLIIIISYLFYRSVFAIIFLSPLSVILIRFKKEQLRKKRLSKLNLQFKDCILSIASSLITGYSIENSLKEAYKDMIILYEEKAIICLELRHMIRQIDLNVPIEKVFEDFALRTGLEDVRLFSSVFQIAKKGGGDLTKIIKSTAGNISEKIEVSKEIETMVSAKKYEQSLMNLIPMFIIAYINYSSPELLKPLYGNLPGIFIMSACLAVYAAAYLISKKIIDIEV